MGIDTEQWRARIGTYNGGRGRRICRTHQNPCVDAVSWTTGEIMGTIPQCVQQGVGVVSLWIILCYFSHFWTRVGSSYPISLSRVYRKSLRAILFVGVTVCTMASLTATTVVLLHFLALLLIMAGDVELNPGPGMSESVHGRSSALVCV